MKTIIILTTLLSLKVFSLVAQTIKTYSGPYEEGKATYQYYEDKNGERIYHGKFTYNNEEGTIKIVGAYKNGKKDGIWTCALNKAFYNMLLTVTGTINASYSNGNKNGDWSYSFSENTSRFEVSGGGTESEKISFKNNIPEGQYFSKQSFNLIYNTGKKSGTRIVKGTFDESGYKTGEWSIQTVDNNLPREQIKRFKKGFCYFLISRISSTGEIENKFDSSEFAIGCFNNSDGIFMKDSIYYALSTPKRSELSTNYEKFFGKKGINENYVDNTGDRSIIRNDNNSSLGEFVGSLGWYAFLNGHYEKSLELSKKALNYDSTFLFVKLNIALVNLKQKKPTFLNDYIIAANCCKNTINRKETLEAGIKDINDLTKQEVIANSDKAIDILETKILKIKSEELALANKKQKERNIEEGITNEEVDSNNNNPSGRSGVSLVRGLSGRRIIHFPNMTDDFNENAKVYVDIKVDAGGRVTNASIARGTTTSNGSLRDIAIEKAKELKFPPSQNGVESGTILLIFRLKK